MLPARFASHHIPTACRCGALLVALLLLGQPLIALLHCQLMGQAAHQRSASPLHSFVCVMDDGPAPVRVSVLSLWPGLPPLVAALAVATILIRRLSWFVALQAPRLSPAPTTPPPR
jgi:hypothetical protein